jgi:hypothetical protein
MTDGILKEILQLEQQIEADLCREQERADIWLAKVCRAIDQELSCEQEESEIATTQKNAETIRVARQRLANKLYQERQWCRSLLRSPDDTLLPLLEDQLKVVLYGRDNDCPDDKS